MSAKEMFVKLGYEYSKINEKIYWEEPNPYELGGLSPYIEFDLINKKWHTNIVEINKYKDLIQAINKQVEELGWLGSDDNE